MQSISLWVTELQQLWRGLIPEPALRALAMTMMMGVFYYFLVLVIERRCGTRTDNYRSRGFVHDIAYYFYFKGGLHRIILPVTLIASLGDSLEFLDFRLIEGLPYPAQLLVFLIVADFVGYWVHRAKHQFRLLWAFHTTHHSQKNVNFATYARIHPVEDIIGQFVGLFLLLILGAKPQTWFLIYIALDLIGEINHTQIPWKFGPLRWIIVTPPFHIYHHSADPAHHNRNFGNLFSFWDRLFRTAVDERTPKPTKFGLEDVKPTSLWRQLVAPFELVYELYRPGVRGR